MSVRAAVAVLALAQVAADPARADDAVPAKARALAERGRADHDRGDYPAAIAAFTEAYALAPSPALLFNLAQAYRLAGRCDDAALMYRRYLAGDPDADAGARLLAQTHLAEPCQPRDDAVALPARSTRERDVGAGLAIVGGFALATSALFAYRASNDADQVSAAYAHGASWASIKDVDASGHRDATVAQVVGGVGAAAAISGIVLYILGDRAQAIAITPRTDGAEVHAKWRF